MQEQQQENIM